MDLCFDKAQHKSRKTIEGAFYFCCLHLFAATPGTARVILSPVVFLKRRVRQPGKSGRAIALGGLRNGSPREVAQRWAAIEEAKLFKHISSL
jgi:hypothetical protein